MHETAPRSLLPALRSRSTRAVSRRAGRPWIVFGLFFFAGCRSSDSADAETVAAGIKAKLKLPVQVDDDTRLDDVRAISPKELGYFLTLTKIAKAQLGATPSLAKDLESHLRGIACENPNYAAFFKAGIG